MKDIIIKAKVQFCVAKEGASLHIVGLSLSFAPCEAPIWK
jgi:hypothetical protein